MPEKQYQIIARRYRPQTFGDVVGQEAIVQTLKNALRMGRLAHAYLFCGSRGTGKTTLARLFAKALNCSKLTEAAEPCNQCPSCLEISAGRSLDVLEIDGASTRGIDDIREITETAPYSPSAGKYKIYIIDEVHMLTKEAFNALLKTLEEPPPRVKFFFATTEPHKVLSTIASRCQRFELSRISEEKIVHKLDAIAKELEAQVEEEALYLLAQKADGSLRDAESLLDQIICYTEGAVTAEKIASHLGITPSSSFFSFDRAIAQENLSFAVELADHVFNTGKDLDCFLDSLMEHFRTLLLIKLGQPLPFLAPKAKSEYLASADLYTEEQCLYILDFLMEKMEQFSQTPLKRLTLEMILLHLIRSRTRVPVETLVKRLVELEKSLGGAPAPAPAIVEKPVVTVVEPPPARPAPVVEKKVEPPPAPPPPTPASGPAPAPEVPTAPRKSSVKHENLLQFAAVELEGTIKR